MSDDFYTVQGFPAGGVGRKQPIPFHLTLVPFFEPECPHNRALPLKIKSKKKKKKDYTVLHQVWQHLGCKIVRSFTSCLKHQKWIIFLSFASVEIFSKLSSPLPSGIVPNGNWTHLVPPPIPSKNFEKKSCSAWKYNVSIYLIEVYFSVISYHLHVEGRMPQSEIYCGGG